LKEKLFERIVKRLAEKPNRLIGMVFLTNLPLLLSFKKNVVIEKSMKKLAKYLDTLNDEVPE
jgi:hypothetical protein